MARFFPVIYTVPVPAEPDRPCVSRRQAQPQEVVEAIHWCGGDDTCHATVLLTANLLELVWATKSGYRSAVRPDRLTEEVRRLVHLKALGGHVVDLDGDLLFVESKTVGIGVVALREYVHDLLSESGASFMESMVDAFLYEAQLAREACGV